METTKLEDMPLPARLAFETLWFILGVTAGFVYSYGWLVG